MFSGSQVRHHIESNADKDKAGLTFHLICNGSHCINPDSNQCRPECCGYGKVLEHVIITTHNFQNFLQPSCLFKFAKMFHQSNNRLLNSKTIHWPHCISVPHRLSNIKYGATLPKVYYEVTKKSGPSYKHNNNNSVNLHSHSLSE